jgi:hypothetical protein
MTDVSKKLRVKLDRPADVGSGAFFVLDFDVEKEFGKKRAPVVVTVNGVSYRSTVSVYGGQYMLVMREEIRKKAGVDVGDVVDVTLAADHAERVVVLPDDMKRALDKAPAKARTAWAAMSYSHQKEHVDWLTSAKKEETRLARVAKWLDALVKMPPKKKKKAPVKKGASSKKLSKKR